jgi:RecA-family ATPase
MAGTIVDFHDDDYHTYTMISDAGQEICRFEVDRVYEDKGAVWGEVTVWYLFDGEPKAPVIAHKRTNMLTATRPGEKDLVAAAEIWPWEEFYEAVMGRTVSAQRKPAPPTRLTPINDSGATAPFLVEPFILSKGVSLMFGPGGTGKSMIGLAFAVAVASGRTVLGRKPSATGPVLYVDYEDTQAVHQLRLNGLLEGLNMTEDDLIHPIMYLKPKTSVSKMRREFSTHMREIQPVLVIVDSVGLGRGGDAMGSEETIRFFQTLNTLDTAVLGIDHMTKDDTRSGKMLTPYGSVYTVNSVRLAWAIKAIDASTDVVRYLNLIQTKRNNVAAHEPVGVTMEFHNTMRDFSENGDVFQPVLQKIELTMNDRYWNESEGTLIDRACDWLELNTRGTIADMAEALGASRDSLEKALKRAEGNRTRRSGTSKPVLWMLGS